MFHLLTNHNYTYMIINIKGGDVGCMNLLKLSLRYLCSITIKPSFQSIPLSMQTLKLNISPSYNPYSSHPILLSFTVIHTYILPLVKYPSTHTTHTHTRNAHTNKQSLATPTHPNTHTFHTRVFTNIHSLTHPHIRLSHPSIPQLLTIHTNFIEFFSYLTWKITAWTSHHQNKKKKINNFNYHNKNTVQKKTSFNIIKK
ncbi:hypothetical protein BC829DRAFT_18978 [Chytridium lagenaria]|nr:hypothetical protein BC829DRAFT_18978 [Chytridium lagenaria]